MEDLNWLQHMIADDDLGLLKLEKKTSALTEHELLAYKFIEINNFVTQHGRLPMKNKENIPEYQLASRLEAIKANQEQVMALVVYDEHNLLSENQD